jgi:Tol biopolymer transport system component
MARFVCTALLLLFFLPALPVAAQVGAFPTNEQLRRFKTMSDPRLAPDGKRILLRVTDSTADGAKSHLWLTGVDGEDPRQLTYSPDADKRGEYDGEWMPDGQSILFLAKRGDHTLLYRLPMNGGEAKPFECKIKPVVDQSKLPDALPLSKPKTDAKPDSDADEVPIDIEHYAIAPDGNRIAIVAQDPQTPGRLACGV